MGSRKTGEMHKPREIVVETCDQCGKDIGLPTGYGKHYPSFEIQWNRHEHRYEDDGATRYLSLCSAPCLVKMAERLASGEKIPEDYSSFV